MKLKSNYIGVIFMVFLVLIFFFEGFGFPLKKELSPALIMLFPLSLLFILNNTKRIKIPKRITLVYMLFILSGLLSLINPVNIFNALMGVGVFTSQYTVFLLSYNLKEKLQNPLINFLLFLSFALPLYSVLARNYLYPFWPNLIPSSGYQLVFAKFGLHNHLGDFLILAAVILIYRLLISKSFKPLLLLFPILPFIFFSYSRSAYTSLLITSLVMIIFLIRSQKIVFSKLKLFLLGLMFISLLIFYLMTVKEFQDSGVIMKNSAAVPLINNKVLWTNRLEFANQAIKGIQENPLTGVGASNFSYISQKFTRFPPWYVDSSHNVFLDIASEMGIFSFIFFLVFIILILKNAQKTEISFFLFIALLINFQTDYTHRIQIMMLLFFILGGFTYKDQNSKLR